MYNLQEAYLGVYYNELDEDYKELPVDKMLAKSKSLSRKPKPPGSPRWGPNDEAASRIRKVAGTHSRAKVKKVEQQNRERGTQREEYDLYDIILSHLLDEGYADTEEAATVIMANMSEDWIDSITEDVLEEGQQGQYQEPPLNYTRQMSKNPKARMSPARRALERSDELLRTEPGSSRQKNQTKQARLMGQALHSAIVLKQKQDKDRKRELGY